MRNHLGGCLDGIGFIDESTKQLFRVCMRRVHYYSLASISFSSISATVTFFQCKPVHPAFTGAKVSPFPFTWSIYSSADHSNYSRELGSPLLYTFNQQLRATTLLFVSSSESSDFDDLLLHARHGRSGSYG